MDLRHQFSVPASLDEAWAAFNHPELIAPVFPGAVLSSVDGLSFIGDLKVKLGTTTLAYTGTGTLLERVRGHRRKIVAEAEGFDRRGKGSLSVTVTTTLTADRDATTVELVLACRFTGRPAQFAAGIVEDAGARLLEQFASELAERFRQGLGPEALAVDTPTSYVSPLGHSLSSSGATDSFSPLSNSARTDFEVFRAVAPRVVRRFAPPLAGGLALLWMLRRWSAPRPQALARTEVAAGPTVTEPAALPVALPVAEPRAGRRRQAGRVR